MQPAPNEPSERERAHFEELKRFMRFGDADRKLLRAFLPQAQSHFDSFARLFYDRIREHDEAHSVLRDESQVERLHGSLCAWMERLLESPYDVEHLQRTQRIGEVHVRVGLPSRFNFAAMSVLRGCFCNLIAELAAAGELDDAQALRFAVNKALDLELAIMDGAYARADRDALQRVEADHRSRLIRSLERAERRYHNLIELAPVIVIGEDHSGQIVLFNRAAEAATGWSATQAMGQHFATAFLSDEVREKWPQAPHSHDGRTLPRPRPQELALEREGGRESFIRWHYAPLTSQEADELKLLSVGIDVTAERMLSQKLLQSEKLASVGTLAAGLAHEIRNPLNGAQLHVTFLERGVKRGCSNADEMMEAVGVVRDEIRRLSELVSEFLEFAKPAVLQRKEVSLMKLIERVGVLLEGNIPEEGVKLVVDMPTSDIAVEADFHKLEQVLLNLGQNAIDAVAEQDDGKLTIRLRRRPFSAVVSVIDNGGGIPSNLDRIFDPFFSTKSKGTGLGLSIAHRIVSDHGGDLTVESKPGHTKFDIELPLPNKGASGFQS